MGGLGGLFFKGLMETLYMVLVSTAVSYIIGLPIGVILNITDKNGSLVAFKLVNNDQDLMIITNSGMIIRLSVNQISQLGRVTQGVRLINLKDNQLVSTISITDKEEELTDIDTTTIETEN